MTTTTAPQAPTAQQAKALAHYLPMAAEARRFSMTSCSQCGADTGPGDSGFSSCTDHLKRDASLDALLATLRGAA
jgi:hypothetical protein